MKTLIIALSLFHTCFAHLLVAQDNMEKVEVEVSVEKPTEPIVNPYGKKDFLDPIFFIPDFSEKWPVAYVYPSSTAGDNVPKFLTDFSEDFPTEDEYPFALSTEVAEVYEWRVAPRELWLGLHTQLDIAAFMRSKSEGRRYWPYVFVLSRRDERLITQEDIDILNKGKSVPEYDWSYLEEVPDQTYLEWIGEEYGSLDKGLEGIKEPVYLYQDEPAKYQSITTRPFFWICLIIFIVAFILVQIGPRFYKKA